MHKREGAINRIHYPTPPRSSGRLTLLLTENTVIRKPLRDAFAQVIFGLSIGDRNVTAVCFRACLRLLAKVLQREGACSTREFDCEVEQLSKLVHPRLRSSSSFAISSRLTPRATSSTSK